MRGRFRLAASMTAVAAVLGTGCATAGSAGHGPGPASPAPSPAVTGTVSAPSGGAESLYAVAALGESDAWAVGTHRPLPTGIYPLTEHWDGKRWTQVPCPSPGSTAEPTRSSLDAVAIDTPDDAWAVGEWSPIEHVPPSYPLIEHWNGAKWTVVRGPSPVGRTTELTAVAAISPTAAWAIGFASTAAGRRVTVFMGWNGTRWRYLPSPVGNSPGGLAAISARDIWLVGEEGTTESAPKYHTLVEHWNGSKWTIVPAPYAYKDQEPNIGLSAVGGSSSTNVWAVGHYQSGPAGTDASPLIEHWDGTRWQLQPSPDPVRPQDEGGFAAIAAVSRTSAWAVGSAFGRGYIPLIERWDGVRWKAMPSRFKPGVTDPSLNGVAAVDPRYAWAVGWAVNQDNRSIALIEKWNGTSWQQVPNPNP
jgi:hypothetical protein